MGQPLIYMFQIPINIPSRAMHGKAGQDKKSIYYRNKYLLSGR